MALVPLGDRIVVRPLEKDNETTVGGIIIPDTAKEKPQEGEVIAVGSGKLLDSGERMAPSVAVGDKVLYGKYAGTEVKYGGEELLIIREDDILAKLDG
jgi:chaperonin GroES